MIRPAVASLVGKCNTGLTYSDYESYGWQPSFLQERVLAVHLQINGALRVAGTGFDPCTIRMSSINAHDQCTATVDCRVSRGMDTFDQTSTADANHVTVL